jgi:hypothetical protein
MVGDPPSEPLGSSDVGIERTQLLVGPQRLGQLFQQLRRHRAPSALQPVGASGNPDAGGASAFGFHAGIILDAYTVFNATFGAPPTGGPSME